jgi:hypothetical protein
LLSCHNLAPKKNYNTSISNSLYLKEAIPTKYSTEEDVISKSRASTETGKVSLKLILVFGTLLLSNIVKVASE